MNKKEITKTKMTPAASLVSSTTKAPLINHTISMGHMRQVKRVFGNAVADVSAAERRKVRKILSLDQGKTGQRHECRVPETRKLIGRIDL